MFYKHFKHHIYTCMYIYILCISYRYHLYYQIDFRTDLRNQLCKKFNRKSIETWESILSEPRNIYIYIQFSKWYYNLVTNPIRLHIFVQLTNCLNNDVILCIIRSPEPSASYCIRKFLINGHTARGEIERRINLGIIGDLSLPTSLCIMSPR